MSKKIIALGFAGFVAVTLVPAILPGDPILYFIEEALGDALE